MASPPKTLQTVIKQIAEAQNLDSEGSLKEAYVKYLQSIQLVTQHLLSGVQPPSGFACDVSTKKMLNLVTMCVQRSEDIVDKQIGTDSQRVTPTFESNRPTPQNMQLWSAGSVSLPAVPVSTSHTALSPAGSSSLPAHVRPAQGSLTVNYRNMEPDLRSPHEASPLEIAERQNRQLMVAYQARISRLGKKGLKATDMNLGLQRRLAENLALAAAREQALAKKRAERRRRLEEITARRFTSTIGMSEDELERRQIYTRILEYEQDNVWLGPWREKLKEKPDDCLLIQQLISQILRTQSHPLTRLLCTFQHRIYNKINPLLIQWQQAVIRSNEGPKVISNPACDDDINSKDNTQPTSKLARDGSLSSLGSGKQFSPADYDISNFDDLYDYGSCPSSPANHSEPNFDVNNSQSSSCKTVVRNEDCESNGQTTNCVQISGAISNNELPSTSESPSTSVPCTDSKASADTSTQLLGAPEDMADSDAGVTTKDTCPMDPVIAPLSLSMLELEREALMRHLGGIVRDIQDLLEKLISMFIVAYEHLDSATGRDACNSSLEEPFYRSIWRYVLSLFRAVHYKEEESIRKSMERHKDCDPVFLKIPRHFCLLPEDSLLMPEGYHPYSGPIQELQALGQMVSPLVKLECIVQVSRSICKCVDDFYKNNDQEAPNIGADDLLPLLSFVVVKTNLPQIFAECQALEELVHEGYLMGEEGYCLTSLETAVRYVMTLE